MLKTVVVSTSAVDDDSLYKLLRTLFPLPSSDVVVLYSIDILLLLKQNEI